MTSAFTIVSHTPISPVFSDASWQDCPDTGRSTVGYMIFYNGASLKPILQCLHLLQCLLKLNTWPHVLPQWPQLTSECFYDMLYLGTKQWRESTQRLPSIPAILMIDNEATVQIAKNGKLTRKTHRTPLPLRPSRPARRHSPTSLDSL
ncbi:hypothetical protein MHU86_18740 [Fragilaria crotonensis]|nr:hypothetical protein MHU86_18740 [Fragilaria crotonensis]